MTVLYVEIALRTWPERNWQIANEATYRRGRIFPLARDAFLLPHAALDIASCLQRYAVALVCTLSLFKLILFTTGGTACKVHFSIFVHSVTHVNGHTEIKKKLELHD
ncbi:hypothetical protein CEXT_447471 [Caerostris extrusa]|uniref:Uncharacterized protein n=1 Tax=Caerostris extrusa TaxID=172846 RepID=A0AAV4USI6_CAEEX|nr:hypothetical protein CEXT_447471 [Caerostris extrusa]